MKRNITRVLERAEAKGFDFQVQYVVRVDPDAEEPLARVSSGMAGLAVIEQRPAVELRDGSISDLAIAALRSPAGLVRVSISKNDDGRVLVQHDPLCRVH